MAPEREGFAEDDGEEWMRALALCRALSRGRQERARLACLGPSQAPPRTVCPVGGGGSPGHKSPKSGLETKVPDRPICYSQFSQMH